MHPSRRDFPGSLSHLCGAVNWHHHLLDPDEAAEIFTNILLVEAERFSIDLYAAVIMGNHYHVLAQSPDEGVFRFLTSRRTSCRHLRPYPRGHNKSQVISQFMRGLKTRSARAIQEELGLTGHLWQGPHFRRRIEDLRDLVITVAYIHRNPVHPGLVGAPEAYPRSSARWWRDGGPNPFRISPRIPFPFGSSEAEFRAALLAYQEERAVSDVFAAFDRKDISAASARGQKLLRQLLDESGIDPLRCGTDAALRLP
ncbi:MAG: transposase [Planctomycetota bacterium]|jgi:REP element-mobilizing transposase RayT